MNNKVSIKQITVGTKNLGKFKVYDVITKKAWANETFDTYDEAETFCNDNKLIIVDKQKSKIVLETTVTKSSIDIEDNGEAKLVDVCVNVDKTKNDDENGIFVRLISICPDKSHHDFNALMGRKIRITIEAID